MFVIWQATRRKAQTRRCAVMTDTWRYCMCRCRVDIDYGEINVVFLRDCGCVWFFFCLLQVMRCCYRNLIRNKKVKPKRWILDFFGTFLPDGVRSGSQGNREHGWGMTGQNISAVRMSHSTRHQSFPSLGLGLWGAVSGGEGGLREATEFWDDLGVSLLRRGTGQVRVVPLGILTCSCGGRVSVKTTELVKAEILDLCCHKLLSLW